MKQQHELTAIPSARRPRRRVALIAGALALAATVAGASLGGRGTHAAGPLHLSVQGPATVEGGFTVNYTWTLATSAPASGIRLDLNVFSLLHPQLSVAGAGGFTCQQGLMSDFFEECTAPFMSAGQSATFTVTGQAPLQGTIHGDAGITIGTPPDSAAGINTTVTPLQFHRP